MLPYTPYVQFGAYFNKAMVTNIKILDLIYIILSVSRLTGKLRVAALGRSLNRDISICLGGPTEPTGYVGFYLVRYSEWRFGNRL